MKILVIGGTSYTNSHTLVELISAGNHVLVLDNLCNPYMHSTLLSANWALKR